MSKKLGSLRYQPWGRQDYPCLGYGTDRRLPGNRSYDNALRESSEVHRLGAGGAGIETEGV